MVVMEVAAINHNPACSSARCRPPRPRQPGLLFARRLRTPNPAAPVSPLSCSAIAPGQSAPAAAPAALTGRLRLGLLAAEFRSLPDPLDRVKRLLAYAASLPAFPEAGRVPANRVAGCTAEVWFSVAMDRELGRMRFAADSDSEIAKGFCSCLVWVLDGAPPEEVLEMRTEDFGELDVVGSPARARQHSRVNTWHNVLTSMQRRTKALIADSESEEDEGPGARPPVEPITIAADRR